MKLGLRDRAYAFSEYLNKCIGPDYCYVRCWHNGERGWFIVKKETYGRIAIPDEVSGLF